MCGQNERGGGEKLMFTTNVVSLRLKKTKSTREDKIQIFSICQSFLSLLTGQRKNGVHGLFRSHLGSLAQRLLRIYRPGSLDMVSCYNTLISLSLKLLTSKIGYLSLSRLFSLV
jgi:hypothetical protein